ncbi:MAG: hypothetical protein K6B67_09340 [Lachnospiraceae bacterium]|nr:hypothetical protein [Lachnospiraceae bacterium]
MDSKKKEKIVGIIKIVFVASLAPVMLWLLAFVSNSPMLETTKFNIILIAFSLISALGAFLMIKSLIRKIDEK